MIRISWPRQARYIGGAIVIVALALLCVIAPRQHMASAAGGATVSPNTDNMQALKYFKTQGGNQIFERDTSSTGAYYEDSVAHIIKNEQSSVILSLKTAAYFSDASNAAQFSIIGLNNLPGKEYARCHITDETNYYANRPFVYVKTSFINTSGVKIEQQFSIYKQNVFIPRSGDANITQSHKCYSTNSHLNTSDADAGGAARSVGTTLYGIYGIKNFSTAQVDPATGLHKVSIEVSYDNNIQQIPDQTDDDPRQQQIGFQEQLPCPSSQPSCGARYMSTVPTDETGGNDGASTARNYSTLRGTTKKPNGSSAGVGYLRQRFGFGLPCNVYQEQIKTVSLYDIDNGSYNFEGGFYIEKYDASTGLWNRLRRNSPEVISIKSSPTAERPSPPQPTWQSSSNFGDDSGHESDQAVVPGNGSGFDASISIKMQPQTRYRMTVTPVPTSNLLGIGLPTETIFGDIGCGYELTPTISSTSSDTVSPGQQIQLDSTILRTNTQSFTNPQADWWISKIITPGGIPADPTGDTAGQPCAANGFVRPTGSTCVDTTWRTVQTFPNASASRSVNYTVENVPPGSKICFIASVHPPTGGSSSWRHSDPICFSTGKRPKVQIWGGDLRSGSMIDTSLTTHNNNLFGSWVEYGAFSVNTNKNFGSGAALGANIQLPAPADDWNKLTFANVNSSGIPSFGNYDLASGPSVAKYFHALPAVAASFSPNLGTLAVNGRYAVGDVSIGGSTITTKGRWIVVDATNHTVNINGDITYNVGALGSAADIPQVIIIGKKINIAANVKRVDAWLIASDSTGTGGAVINTCSEIPAGSPSSLTTNKCTQQLQVNGPVMTDQLYLYRTANSDNDSNAQDPAEIFNYRADALLWIYSHMSSDTAARTVEETDLPPRY